MIVALLFLALLAVAISLYAWHLASLLADKDAKIDDLNATISKAHGEICCVRSMLSEKVYDHHRKATAGDCCCKKKLHFDFGEELRNLFETSKTAENVLFGFAPNTKAAE